jgi:hypothetical protein
MDFAIDRTGRVDSKHAARYKQFGAWLTSCYASPVAQAATPIGGACIGAFSVRKHTLTTIGPHLPPRCSGHVQHHPSGAGGRPGRGPRGAHHHTHAY